MLDQVPQAALEAIRNVSGSTIDFNLVISGAAEKLGNVSDKRLRFAVSIFLNDLLRNGILAFGNNAGSWTTDVAFLTDAGRKTLEHASRDPMDHNGYLDYLDKQVVLDAVARSYVEEALNTYRACCYKATAVLVGAAVEKLSLDLRDELLTRLKATGKTIPKGLEAWQVKTALEAVADAVLPDLGTDAKRRPDEIVRKLREDAESRLLPIAAEFRRLRNDAGHPASLGPVDPTDVHASLLLFPSTAKLFKRLRDWVVSYYV